MSDPTPAEPVSTAASTALLPSIIRTVVPLLVGLVITGLLKLGIDWEDDGGLTELITALVTAVYYALVRVLETRFGSAWGWLLGLARPPAYEKV